MPDYLADRFASWMGWGSPGKRDLLGMGLDEEETPSGYRGARGTDPADQRITVTDLTEQERTDPALAATWARSHAPVTPPSRQIPPMLAARDDPRALLPANLPAPRVAPGATAPRSPPGAGPPMPQAGGGGQPQPLMPSGAAPNFLGRAGAAVGDFLGGVKDWANAPMYDPSKPTSRWDAIAMTLGNVGAGLSQTGRIGAGLRMGNQGLMQLRQGEQQRAGDEEEREYRRLTAEAQLARALKPAAGASSETERYIASLPPEQQEAYRRRRLETLVTEGKAPTTIEGALVDPNASPEIRAQAERLWAEKNAPSAKDKAYIDHLNATGQHQKAMEEIARINAKRPTGSGTPPAPTTLGKLFQERAALPPGDPRIAMYDKMIETETVRGRAGVDATTRETGYLPPPPAAQSKAAEAVSTIDDLNARIAGIEAMDADLPDLMTSPAQGMASLTAAAERWGVPVSTAQTQYLEKQRTLATQLEDLTSTIRLARAGQTLTGPELASAEKYLPTAGDSVTTLRTKLKELKKIAATARRRNVDILDPKKGIRREPEATAQPPARTAPADAAGTVQLGAPKPGDVQDGYRFKGGDPASPDSWEQVQ